MWKMAVSSPSEQLSYLMTNSAGATQKRKYTHRHIQTSLHKHTHTHTHTHKQTDEMSL